MPHWTLFNIAKKYKRGESENCERYDWVAGKVARKKVRQRCKAIGADCLVALTYLAKYCTKEMECRDFDQKRYFSSKGIPEPEIVQWRLHSDDMHDRHASGDSRGPARHYRWLPNLVQ